VVGGGSLIHMIDQVPSLDESSRSYIHGLWFDVLVSFYPGCSHTDTEVSDVLILVNWQKIRCLELTIIIFIIRNNGLENYFLLQTLHYFDSLARPIVSATYLANIYIYSQTFQLVPSLSKLVILTSHCLFVCLYCRASVRMDMLSR